MYVSFSCHNYSVSQVDFLQLQMNTLRRYKRHYKLQLKPGTNKIQLVEVRLDFYYYFIKLCTFSTVGNFKAFQNSSCKWKEGRSSVHINGEITQEQTGPSKTCGQLVDSVFVWKRSLPKLKMQYLFFVLTRSLPNLKLIQEIVTSYILSCACAIDIQSSYHRLLCVFA